MEDHSSNDLDKLFESFVSLQESQLKQLGIPQNKWKCLFKKLNEAKFDGEDDFFLFNTEEDEDYTEYGNSIKVFTQHEMDPEDDNNIYLIDHAFTYYLGGLKHLATNDEFLKKMCDLINVEMENFSNEETLKIIEKKLWKFNSSYIWKKSDGEFERYWFIMEELGSTIKRHYNPTFSIVPFAYINEGIIYSLLFPIAKVEEFDEVTIAYPRYDNSLSEEMKKILIYPWKKSDLSNIDFNQSEPDIDYLTSGRLIEIFPDDSVKIPPLSSIKKIKVYTDYPLVSEFLTLPRFYFTNEKSEAHILWLSDRVYDYRTLADPATNSFYVNQFPSEQVLINKDLLAIICRRSYEDSNFDMLTLKSFPSWLPTTFSLLTELPKFVSYFQNREKKNLDNVWIIKPFNQAGCLDIFITDNLDQIIRLTEIRPMVACKYITDPVLFPLENKGLVKMDLRFIVLLKSIQNFELFVYNKFWIRFANEPFSLDDFNNYEKHFTVMNYNEDTWTQMVCHDFVKKFEDHYKSYKWSDIEAEIHTMIKDVFIAAAMKEHPAGIGTYSGSRAVYGFDIMLEWDRSDEISSIKPMILEVNWMPNCKRACHFYPEFYDDVFSVLFLDETAGKNVVQL